MQINTVRLLLVTIFVAISVASCTSNEENKNSKSEDTTASVPAALPVDVKIITEAAIEQTEAVAGSVVPNRTVEIMSELAKKVTAVYFKDGSFVSQGQVLYELDDADVKAKIRQLRADLNLAKIDEHRLSELLKTETVRQEEYDIALAKLQSLEAAQDILQLELSKTLIRAPFPGVAGFTKVYVGTLVSPGMSLVSFQEQDVVKIQFTVSEKYLPLVNAGSSIQFSTELNKEKITAKVVSTEASIDMQSRNITVQAITTNAGRKLKAGMSAKVYFNTSRENAKAITVPTEALIPGGNGYSVFVVKNNTASITPVTIRSRNEKDALISSGLNSGDTVMVSNMLRATDGIPVTVVTSH
ncbi:efflux RND transporter periplasmic adaptor subunit [Paraflavitalea sp. CAU 1676]|uniref:efflux RND transporter periplasmic adaptor subunit n=1 Tax=Paraflavitalea sp. CAU 1676 TaxID=3032598 RepID=UPI0023DCA459|nr:efflux RND transporter periplasmic adaptor subunit [Paraflavitalea sp. CAU 1676]MDF2191347.1 efflux RND transporter periplasmic adaptor subunit [Paraflavitalea sp. CAU 1676]